MKIFSTVNDVKNISELIDLARELKKNPFEHQLIGKNKTLGLLFFNPSLRTRLSTQRAATNLGMNVIVMNLNSDGWSIELADGTLMNQGTQEHIKEAAGVVSQYCDIIGIRTFASLKNRSEDYNETVLNKFIANATVPVLSLESATRHPLQSLADAITIEEQKTKKIPKVVLTWAPHPKALPQAVSNSFIEWMEKREVELVVTHPMGYELADTFNKNTKVIYDQEEAFKNADFIYAKNWSSYEDYGKCQDDLEYWTVTEEKMQLTNKGKFMHCLPVRRNVVVTDAVLDSEASIVLEQANNRTYAAQAVLLKMLTDEN